MAPKLVTLTVMAPLLSSKSSGFFSEAIFSPYFGSSPQGERKEQDRRVEIAKIGAFFFF